MAEPVGCGQHDGATVIPSPRAKRRSLLAGGVATRVLVVGIVVLLSGCGDGTAGGARGAAAAALQDVVDTVHATALGVRAADPAAADDAAADDLAQAVTGGDPASLLSATATADGVEALTTVGVRVEEGGGLFYGRVTLGVCLLISATPGLPAGDVGERGAVTTEAVPCPEGVTPVVDGGPVDATTLEIDRLQSPVPLSRPAPCYSGSGDCEGGG